MNTDEPELCRLSDQLQDQFLMIWLAGSHEKELGDFVKLVSDMRNIFGEQLVEPDVVESETGVLQVGWRSFTRDAEILWRPGGWKVIGAEIGGANFNTKQLFIHRTDYITVARAMRWALRSGVWPEMRSK